MSEFNHEPVLLRECIEMLSIKSDGVYIDGTLGGAGHSSYILQHLGENGILIGLDQDEDAIKVAAERLQQIKDAGKSKAEYIIVKTNFEKMSETASCILERRGRKPKADGILLDIGVSSYQFDEPERGFSYRYDASLDMRMNRENPLTAEMVINEYSEKELARIIKEYGEEKWASAIAKMICRTRKIAPIRTTFELVDVIKAAIPARARQSGGHPAKRTFQAIRIELNRELDVLRDSLDDMIDLLNPGGRLCIITFHSLEDRIVKTRFRNNENPCTCPPSFPACVCGKVPKGRVITRKPVVPTDEEINENSRSKSSKLRVFERV